VIPLLLAAALKISTPPPLTCAELKAPEIAALAGKDVKITLNLEKTSLDRVFKALGEQARFHTTFRGYTPVVNANLSDVPLERALADLARQYGLSIRAIAADRLEVAGPLAPDVGGVGRPTLKTKKGPSPGPELARFGKVVLQVVVCEDGKVGAIAASPGTEEPRLVDTAIEAVRQWIYEPALRDGKPVAVSLTTVVDFRRD